MAGTKLSTSQIAARKPQEFRHVMDLLATRYRTADFAAALRLADAVGAVADEMNHHPDLGVHWGRLDVTLTSHDTGGVTERDLELAERISGIAAEQGAEPAPEGVQTVDWGLDTWAGSEVKPFWDALLGYAGKPHPDEVVDPYGTGPTIWFQDTDEHPTPRQRFHMDIWVDPAEARARVQAALAAGGTMADESHAPSFWVLADAQGNRACICSAEERDQQ